MVNVVVKSAAEMGADDWARWRELRAGNPALYSPYFNPFYTQLVAELTENVWMLVVYDKNMPIAFLPYHGSKSGGGLIRPVGAPMTDYHGLICASDADFDLMAALDAAGINAFHFGGLVKSAPGLSYGQYQSEGCVALNLSEGGEAWRARQGQSYKRHYKGYKRRIRKTENLYGAPKFDWRIRDRAVFDLMVKWKCEKFAQTGKYNVLSAGWTLDLLRILWETGYGDLKCDLHALYIDDRPAAIDLGLVEGSIFHGWMTGYDTEFHALSPGIQAVEGLITHAQELGYSWLDMGVGTEGYKGYYASEGITVMTGFIATTGPRAQLAKLYGLLEQAGEDWAQKDRALAGLGRAPGKLRRRYSQISACDESFSGRSKAMLQAVKSSLG